MADSGTSFLRRHLPSLAFVGIAAAVLAVGAAAFIYLGVYNIAADAPHTRPVYWAIENLRERSVEVRARGVQLPSDIGSPTRLARGAGLYAEMCAGCHLAPGMAPTEISQGLYPPAPQLSRVHLRDPRAQFWTIKHGVKMTAMPAWGRTHGDALIWDMVAFVRKLPSLSPAQYQAMVQSAPAGHDEMMQSMPGMSHHEAPPAEAGHDERHAH